jgi:hypothetical protein
MHFTVEVSLFFAIEDHKIDAILECLQRGGHSLLRTYLLIQLTPSGIHATLGKPFLNLPLSQDTHEPVLLLA